MTRSYSKRDLQRLPRLDHPTNQSLHVFTTTEGLKLRRAGQYNVHKLVTAKAASEYGGSTGVVFVPDPDVDLLRTNAWRRRLHTLGPPDQQFLESVNDSLQGGKAPHPVIMALLGYFIGKVEYAGTLLSITQTIVDIEKPQLRVLARSGDELWLVERVGWAGNQLKFVEYIALVDPFRSEAASKGARGKGSQSVWIIHEERHDLVVG